MFMFYEVLHSDFTMLDATLKYIKKYFLLFFIHTATLLSLAAMHVDR